MTDKKQVEVTLSVAVNGVRSAVKNAATLEEVVLDLPSVDPKKLSIDDKIYGLRIVPVKDTIKSPTPSTICTVGVIDINVDTLSGVVRKGMVTINTDIDIPKEIGHTHNVEDVYFEEKEYARAIALNIVEEQMTKAEDNVTEAEEIYDFLKEQWNTKRV